MACDWESEVLGIRKAFMTMFFSSSVGMNTWPSWVKSNPAMTSKTTAPAVKVSGVRIARLSAGSRLNPMNEPALLFLNATSDYDSDHRKTWA
jgi:hypothetical protein